MEKVWSIKNDIIKETLKDIKPFNKILFKNLNIIFKNSVFLDRDKAENDENFKQIIPYVIFKNTNDQILITKRTKNQSEKRLHEKISAGIGGHINLNDYSENPEMTFFNGLNREINEELKIKDLEELKYLGLIYDDSNEVSRVHIGILFTAQVKNAEIKEVENFEANWLKKEEIENLKEENFETWTKISLNQLNINI
ncbi:NUDIX domain-containing protein [Oceanotoga teriensis]|uniref:NUDIX domain-containing protein n=1 Tax=Oceanotoga teriensis TaxID=515440 RepID=UPI00271337D2|nr:NUDIX domain-containing protein [Oceanotoga teriensis]MDO7977385.1 NUDIX domain-containing protein [Oceanotoga teriensis]